MAISGYISAQPEQQEFTERVAIAFKDEYINCKVITDNIRISNMTFKFTFYNIDDITKKLKIGDTFGSLKQLCLTLGIEYKKNGKEQKQIWDIKLTYHEYI